MKEPTSDHTSRETVLAAQRGDEAALEALLERHLPGIRAFVRLRSDRAFRARESASDVVQSVCLQVLANLDGFEWRGEASFRQWLYAHAMNKILNHGQYHRAARRDPRREHAGGTSRLADLYRTISSPSQMAVAGELTERFEAAMDRLPPDYREVIVLSRLVGLDHAAIAAQMDRTETATRALLSRALGRLATLMDRPT